MVLQQYNILQHLNEMSDRTFIGLEIFYIPLTRHNKIPLIHFQVSIYIYIQCINIYIYNVYTEYE